MEFNINGNVHVTLTDRGVEVMKKKNPNMFEFHFDPKTNEVDEQLWVIMNTFGEEMYMGFDNVFENNTINFPDNEIKELKKAIDWAFDLFKPVLKKDLLKERK